jgi:hypothetical protein
MFSRYPCTVLGVETAMPGGAMMATTLRAKVLPLEGLPNCERSGLQTALT